MDKFEAYSYLFTDSIISSFAFSLNSELVIDVMKAFGNYNTQVVFLLALAGSIIGLSLNWSLGIILRKFFKGESSSNESTSLKKGEKIFKKYFYLSPIFAFIPLWGPFVTLSAGIFRMNYLHLFILSLMSKSGYYYFKLFIS